MKKISGWISSSKTKRALAAAALMTLTLGWLAAPGARAQQRQDGRVRARGAFTCDFALPGDFPFDRVAPVIERDRMYMAERPGMRRKQIPMRFDPSNGQLLTGGRYLFDTVAQEAQRGGVPAVGLPYTEQDTRAKPVYYANRLAPQNPYVPDFASLGAL